MSKCLLSSACISFILDDLDLLCHHVYISDTACICNIQGGCKLIKVINAKVTLMVGL